MNENRSVILNHWGLHFTLEVEDGDPPSLLIWKEVGDIQVARTKIPATPRDKADEALVLWLRHHGANGTVIKREAIQAIDKLLVRPCHWLGGP